MTARDFYIAIEAEKGVSEEKAESKADYMDEVFELMEMFAEYKLNQIKAA